MPRRPRAVRPRFAAIYGMLAALVIVLVACGPTATPEVIRDFSRANTLTAMARPSLTPTGPTQTATQTSTPYIRPTDSPDLDLSLPLARVGEETITLGQFRARVRYERFAALDEARRTVERLGFERLNFATSGQNQAADRLASIFSTLANSQAFGRQIYDLLVREAIIRQEAARRGLTVSQQDIDDYWVRNFGLQTAPDRYKALEAPLNAYIEEAGRYSSVSRADLMRIAESFVQASVLGPIISRENPQQPSVLSFKLKRLVAATRADADAALAELKAGQPFREVACRYSTLPATRGNGGDLGFVTRGGTLASVQDVARVFETEQAEIGAVIGPLQSPLGWHIFRVTDKRRNADGDTEVRAQMILVASESLARQIAEQAQGASVDDFGRLACQYSLDRSGGDGGDQGEVAAEALPPALAQALQAAPGNGLVGPVETAAGFEVALMEDRQVNIASPEEVEKAARQAFQRWQDERANSAYVTVLSDAWKQAIPADPLPREVAPFLREENFGLPTPAPTATP